jgi:uncharacterized protein
MPNPFFYGGRIENPKDFIGRKTELRAIFSALEHFKEGQAQHISIVGERRIGKSSLLYHVTNIYKQYLSQPANYHFMLVDLDNSRTHTLLGLLNHILKQLEVNTTKHPSLEEFNDALENVRNKTNIYPILCLDEFEHLASRRNEFSNSVFEEFRSLGSNNKLAFIITSKSPLSNLINQSHMTSTFPNIFTQLPLGEFTESEVLQLLQRGRVCEYPFSNEEIRRTRLYGGRHPYKLQVAGSKIYLAKAEGNINWKKVEISIKNQIASVSTQNQVSLTKVTATFLQGLGRAILEVRKGKNEISDSSALWWGIIAILILILLIIGLPFGWFFKFVIHWLSG